jgi:hypothetical protein
MSWVIEIKESVLQKYMTSRPKDVDFSEAEILSEVNAIRYKQ